MAKYYSDALKNEALKYYFDGKHIHGRLTETAKKYGTSRQILYLWMKEPALKKVAVSTEENTTLNRLYRVIAEQTLRIAELEGQIRKTG